MRSRFPSAPEVVQRWAVGTSGAGRGKRQHQQVVVIRSANSSVSVEDAAILSSASLIAWLSPRMRLTVNTPPVQSASRQRSREIGAVAQSGVSSLVLFQVDQDVVVAPVAVTRCSRTSSTSSASCWSAVENRNIRAPDGPRSVTVPPHPWRPRGRGHAASVRSRRRRIRPASRLCSGGSNIRCASMARFTGFGRTAASCRWIRSAGSSSNQRLRQSPRPRSPGAYRRVLRGRCSGAWVHTRNKGRTTGSRPRR